MILLYRMVLGVLRAVAPALEGGDSKLARGLAGRRRAHELLEVWGRNLRDPDRPVVWLHASSLGEGLVAESVMNALRVRLPEAQFVYTFFSPSAEPLARTIDADAATDLPWDLRGPMSRVLDALEPDMIVFARGDVWPVLVSEASARGVPLALVGGVLSERSRRLRWPARGLLRRSWKALAVVGATTEGDAARFERAGVPAAAVQVVGDPAVDAAATRYRAHDLDLPWMRRLAGADRRTLVAGSTWPSDHDVLLPALEQVRAEIPSFRVILVPHEPTDALVDSLRRRLDGAGWTTITLTELEAGAGRDAELEAGPGCDTDTEAGPAAAADVVIVDRVGPLAQMYRLADVAWVGGGFGADGLHSVLEPAVASVPVIAGPGGGLSPTCAALIDSGGAELAATSDAVARILVGLLGDTAERQRRGAVAAEYIARHAGAADRCARILHEMLETQA